MTRTWWKPSKQKSVVLILLSLCMLFAAACSPRQTPSSSEPGRTTSAAGSATDPYAPDDTDPTVPDETDPADPTVPGDGQGGGDSNDPDDNNPGGGNVDKPKPTTTTTTTTKTATTTTKPTSPTDPMEPDPGQKGVPVVQDGEFQMAIVWSAGANSEERKVSNDLYELLKQHFGDGVQYRSDAFEPTEGQPELLVGKTNRAASKKALDTIKAYRTNNAADYIIQEDNGNLVINAENPKALKDAADLFLNNVTRKGLTEVAKGYYSYNKPTLKTATIAGKRIDSFKIVKPRDASYMYGKEVSALHDMLRKSTGYDLAVVDDRTAAAANEILVGPTNRSQSSGALAADKYAIKEIDGKLVIRGGENPALAMGIRQLQSLVNASGGLAIPANYNKEGAYTPTGDDYRLVFSDEFNGSEIDMSKWSIRTWSDIALNGGRCFYTDERENIRVENGNLVISGRRKGETDFTTGFLRTSDRLHYVYGMIEIRAKLTKEQGAWPAFWNTGLNPLHQEIDVLELFSENNASISACVHKWWNEKDIFGNNVQKNWHTGRSIKREYDLPHGETYNDAYHTFGLEWTPEKMVFSVDGNAYFEYAIDGEGQSMHHIPVYIVLSMAVGMDMLPLDDDPFKPDYMVDWIRLYQQPSNGQLIWSK